MAQVDHVIQMLWGIRTQDADCTMKWEVCDIYLFFFFFNGSETKGFSSHRLTAASAELKHKPTKDEKMRGSRCEWCPRHKMTACAWGSWAKKCLVEVLESERAVESYRSFTWL